MLGWFLMLFILSAMSMTENEMLIAAEEGCDFVIIELHTCYFNICQLLFTNSVANYYVLLLQIKLA